MQSNEETKIEQHKYEFLLIQRAFDILKPEGFEKNKAEERKLIYSVMHKICENEEKTKQKMTEKTLLDKHKMASCICAAIAQVRPFENCIRYTNEMLAVGVSVTYLWHMMIEEEIAGKSQAMKKYLRKKLQCQYRLKFPGEGKDGKDRYGDKGDYFQNMCHDIENATNYCLYKKDKCDQIDIFAYSKIFYHLEEYNKDSLKDICLKEWVN